jgi:hypothetical protein
MIRSFKREQLMCRSIKVLRRRDVIASPEEIEAAALQFVRKVSGYHKPSSKNEAAFDTAVGEITAAAARLLESITTAKAAS